ncbi:MAG: hypothetical protein RO469_11255 [Thermincola sp.]|jgi:hypothetical protein|nr:hypothetical protein [Thermincola sp.]MDT3701579.1 hypothetical protein [Thermincola sp.]
MWIKMGKGKYLLLMTVLSLIVIGLSYALASAQSFKDSALVHGSLMELVPEECRVLETSPSVLADLEFQRDRFGNIIDKTNLSLMAANVYAGAHAEFRITTQNISDIALSVDEYKVEIDQEDNSLADLIYFSGVVKIIRGGGQYHDVLGSFKNVSLIELGNTLTAIFEYRKIDIAEKTVLELNQQFENDPDKFAGRTGLSYRLVPVFVQYFPKSDKNSPESE